MKMIKIFTLFLLSLLLTGCGVHRSLDRTPARFAVTEELMQAELSEVTDCAEELPAPLNRFPREIFQEATDAWEQYLLPPGYPCFLYSYEHDGQIFSYMVVLDITDSPARGFPNNNEYQLVSQSVQVRLCSSTAVMWDRQADTLTVWEDAPLTPTVTADIKIVKSGDTVGTVLHEWVGGGTVAAREEPPSASFPFDFLAILFNQIFSNKTPDALTELRYGIIEDVEHNGTVTAWIDHSDSEYTHDEDALRHCRDTFQTNYKYQSLLQNGMGIGGVWATHWGTMTDAEHYFFLECYFYELNDSVMQDIEWEVGVAVGFEK